MKHLWVRKGTLEEEAEADRQFWQQTTGLERLEALAELQREIWGDHATSQGLHRIARIVEREVG
jgi:hypothetical protein